MPKTHTLKRWHSQNKKDLRYILPTTAVILMVVSAYLYETFFYQSTSRTMNEGLSLPGSIVMWIAIGIFFKACKRP